jgi:NAD(P)H-hydrate epimerase
MRVDASETAGIPAEAPDLIVDGVIGYSLRGAPRGRAAALIHGANESAAPVLALDVPSGLDGTTGAAAEPVTRAAATMTLAMPKQGLRSGLATGLVGELYLADIGVPPALYARHPLRLNVPDVFAQGDVVRLQ